MLNYTLTPAGDPARATPYNRRASEDDKFESVWRAVACRQNITITDAAGEFITELDICVPDRGVRYFVARNLYIMTEIDKILHAYERGTEPPDLIVITKPATAAAN